MGKTRSLNLFIGEATVAVEDDEGDDDDDDEDGDGDEDVVVVVVVVFEDGDMEDVFTAMKRLGESTEDPVDPSATLEELEPDPAEANVDPPTLPTAPTDVKLGLIPSEEGVKTSDVVFVDIEVEGTGGGGGGGGGSLL